MSKRYHLVNAGEGPSYDWDADNPFVKVSGAETGGAYALIEDNLKATFALGLHLHETHAETFYVLEGALDFFIDGDWIRAEPGTTIHIPPKVPHACRVSDRAPARMLMIMQPSGFDAFLAELGDMGPDDFADEAKMADLNSRHDIVPLGPVPDHPDD